jgi:Pregnancy-associated plasma protein-A
MKNTPDTSSTSEISRPKIGRFDMLKRRIGDTIMATAMALAPMLTACEFNDDKDPKAESIEKCYDPDHREQFPLHQNIFIALAVHIVMNSDGTSNIDEDSIRENITDIRRVYGDMVRDFYVTSVKRVPETALQPYMVPEESREDYEERLKAYIDENGTDGAVDIMYIPGDTGVSGTYLTTPAGEEFIVLYTDNEGKTYLKKAAAHELGHLFELKHPFDADGGDGLGDTINYSQACAHVQSIITYMDGDVCMASCGDGSNAAVVNLMDYNICYGAQGQTLQVYPEGLTQDQVKFSNCVLSSAKTYYVNPGLPEADFE